MTDYANLIEWARKTAEIADGAGTSFGPLLHALADAVDELIADRDALSVGLNEMRKHAESAEAERDRLAAALKEIRDALGDDKPPKQIAREALASARQA